MRTFTFKFDPKSSIKGMLEDFKVALKTGKGKVEQNSLTAHSIEAILATMTKTKLDLFYCVAQTAPGSLYELAHLLNRDKANVLREARALEGMGLIELRSVQENGREKLQPIALYDRIVFDFGTAVSKPKRQSRLKRKRIVS